jgi:hypothetical protein
MSEAEYQPDLPRSAIDAMIVAGSGLEPKFDSVEQVFLHESHTALKRTCARGGLLQFRSLGRHTPWIYRLTFSTKGFVREAGGEVCPCDRHVVALRFLPGFLRTVDRFACLKLIEPFGKAFHPNVSPDGAICVEIYPGEPLVEICHSLHDLFRWRLRQYDERDALNPAACAWGRENIDKPIDDRPLFGKRSNVHWHSAIKKGN